MPKRDAESVKLQAKGSGSRLLGVGGAFGDLKIDSSPEEAQPLVDRRAPAWVSVLR